MRRKRLGGDRFHLLDEGLGRRACGGGILTGNQQPVGDDVGVPVGRLGVENRPGLAARIPARREWPGASAGFSRSLPHFLS
jgi:hypothetical protein